MQGRVILDATRAGQGNGCWASGRLRPEKWQKTDSFEVIC